MLLAGIYIPARIGGDAADGEKLPRESAAAAEAPDRRERVALQDDDFLVVPVGDEDEALLSVIGKRDVPGGPERRDRAELAADRRAFRVFRHDAFLHEFAVFLEYLDAIAGAIAN